MKRFPVIGITRDKEYNLTKGTANSRVMYFSANPNGEAEVLRIVLKPKPRLRSLVFEMDFSEMAIKGRNSLGNTLTKNDIHKITLKEKGVSTLGGRDIWFDHDVLRLNTEKRGEYLGEFEGEDRILVVTKKGDYYLTTRITSYNVCYTKLLRPPRVETPFSLSVILCISFLVSVFPNELRPFIAISLKSISKTKLLV